jgi:hypothetical protein
MALNIDMLKKEMEEASKQKAEGDFWVPEYGENLIRILPPKGDGLFYKKVGVHYKLVGSGMEFCPSLTEGHRCPICEVVNGLRKMQTPGASGLVKRLAVVERYLMNIIVLNGPEKHIMQYFAPKTVRLELLKIVLDPDYGDITDLETGRNVVIEKEQGNGGFVTYTVRAKPKQVPVSELMGRQIKLDEFVDLNELVSSRMKSYDDLKYALYGGEEMDSDELIEKYNEKEGSSASAGASQSQSQPSSSKKGEEELEDVMRKAQEIMNKLKK